jgi:hypothetical protein
MPPGAAPIVIADAGFKIPLHRDVEALGRAGARTRTRVSEVPLEQLQEALQARDGHSDGARRRRVGA